MNRVIYILILLLAATSCVSEVFPSHDMEDVPEGYVRIEFTATAVDPKKVDTRAVDPDGIDVNNMTLFCFNEFGLFISTETATIVQHTAVEGISDSGTYSAVIPNHTQIIHFLANHSEGLYDESNFPGQTESMVIANMEGGSGMLVYWSRFQMNADSDKNITEQLSELKYTIAGTTYSGVKLIRNQAKITIDDWGTDPATNPEFVVTGFRTVNIPAFGTVAPHHPQYHFKIVNEWETLEDFVTLPDNQALMSDIVDINTKNEDFIFETENSGDRLVSVIIKGHAPDQTSDDDKYYRIVLQHSDGTNFMIRRNHNYNIRITGMLTYGQNTFEEALNAPASNNAWISIDEWVNEITDGVQTLSVDKTSYVLASDEYAGTNWSFSYRYTRNGSGDSVGPDVTWLENNIAYDAITNDYNTTTGEGKVTLRFYPMYEGNEQQVGSLLIKRGQLQRKVSIYIIRTQKFTPSWISSQVFGVADENVTLMFTVPETCPESLFPFTVLVSANHLDIRSESGQQLPVYIKGEQGYFGQDWEGINYKYAYTVTAPGKHRLHMQSILKHEENDTEEVHLEADFFETITKTVVFRGHNYEHRRIYVNGLHEHDFSYAQDEELYYILVPQKKAAPIMFNVELQRRASDDSYVAIDHAADPESDGWHRNGRDEFLIYTKYLSIYDDYFSGNEGRYDVIRDNFWEVEAMPVREELWSTNGRVMAFRTHSYDNSDAYGYGLQTDGNYNVYMLTNASSGHDVIRISANNDSSGYVFESDRSGNPYSGMYDGNEYRSVIFDLGRFRPFRFAAQICVSEADGSNPELIPASSELMSNAVNKDQEEVADDVYFSYKPGQRVDLMLDVTSFKGSTGRSVHPFGERFGDDFEIYIDAPMLEIDYGRIPDNWLASRNPLLKVDKLRKDPSVDGRFIYNVDSLRTVEREFGFAPAHNTDDSVVGFDDFGAVVPYTEDQSGERKLLPFKKSSITSGGDITISTNKDKVVFWDKTFHVDTRNMMGRIAYKRNGQLIPVPRDAFIAFVRMRTGARIGVVTIQQDGIFELNLREEYRFEWKDDPIDFYYKDPDGNVYSWVYEVDGEQVDTDLDFLYEIIEKDEMIVLTKSE